MLLFPMMLSGCSGNQSTPSTPSIHVNAAPAGVSASMCQMPAYDVNLYGDYPVYIEAIRLGLEITNDHNITVNRLNGAATVDKQ